MTCLDVLVLLLLDYALFNLTRHVFRLLCMQATACSAVCMPLYRFSRCVSCQQSPLCCTNTENGLLGL